MMKGGTTRRWESLRTWAGLSLGGFWVSAGVSVGGNRPRMKNHDDEWMTRKWEWFRQAQPNGFGVGGLVCFDRLSTTPAAGCGFRRARLWGERGDQRMGNG